MTNLIQRVRGLVACLALLILVIGYPLILITIGFAPWDADLSELQSMLTRPDDGTLALAVFAGIGWAAWAVLTGSVLLAAVAEIRRVPAPSIPGLALPQYAAARLVGIAALLFVAAPTVVAALPPAHSAAVAPLKPAATAEAEPVASTTATHHAQQRHTLERSAATRDYTVLRGDSLWRIAERLLGNGTRYSEIVALNSEALNGRPDFITPGTVLQVPDERPADPGAPTDDAYVVAPGDTLSEIAEAELGDAGRYPEIYEASSDTAQPDGAHLADPDLILPGWKLTIPGRDDPIDETPSGPDPVRPTPQEDDTPPASVPPTEVPRAEGADSPRPTPPARAEGDDGDSAGSPFWLVTGLAGSGVLVGGVLLAVRAHRRTQLRYRRPGQTLAPPPPDLVNVDKTAQVHGAPAAVDIEGLDRALRHLAVHAQDAAAAAPALSSICLAAGLATVHLRQPATLPDPWQGDGCGWTMKLGAVQDELDVLPPYPLLVSIGEDDTGSLWLVNLEELGSIAITGDYEAGLALARHLAAELALNPWSLLVQTDTFGLGNELADLDTHRLRVHAEEDPGAHSLVAELQAEAQSGCDDPDPFHVLITRSPDVASAVVEAIDGANCRLGTAVVLFDSGVPECSTAFEVDDHGRLTIAALELTGVAAGLTAQEAALCAAIVDVTRITPTIDIPIFAQAADGWRSLTDQAGALREELTEPRPPGQGGERSFLPESADDYVAVAATTPADIEELAPVVTDTTRQAVEDADPALDDDLAAWFDNKSSLPRLTLLGPVRASAHGDVVAVAKRRPYFVELLSFLALHPEGVNAQAIADAFNISKSRARTDVGFVRDWLGVDPRTGQLHLPRRGRSNEPHEQSAPGYHVEDLLVDADLFRRLRARGQARGAEGMQDLTDALHLVSGQPFDQLRDQGWNWLFEGDRLHETIPCAIVDTAHIVVVDALHRGDLDLAREAAETACLASPYDDVARLDLAKVLEAQGHGDSADRTLNEDVFNRRDDDEAPIDLPTRTHEIVARKGWGQPRQSKACGPSPRPHAS